MTALTFVVPHFGRPIGKSAQLKATDVAGHAELFQWCLQHSLLSEAQNQIDILQMMEGLKATRLEYLHRQLVVSRDLQRKRSMPEERTAALRRDTATGGSTNIPLDSETSDREPKIAQVNFEIESPTPLTSLSELQRAADSLPKEGVVMFKRKIEPLVARSCFTADCHNTRDHEMALMCPGTDQLFPKRVSQRNLYSILKYVDTHDPLNSPFFLAATGPHAGQDEPFIKRGTKQFEILRQWLAMISCNPAGDYELPAAATPIKEVEPQLPAPDQNTIGPILNKTNDQFPVPPTMPSLDAEPPKKAIRRDPFDPDVFNRRFGSKKND